MEAKLRLGWTLFVISYSSWKSDVTNHPHRDTSMTHATTHSKWIMKILQTLTCTWWSMAQWRRMCFLLARTTTNVRRYLSCTLVWMIHEHDDGYCTILLSQIGSDETFRGWTVEWSIDEMDCETSLRLYTGTVVKRSIHTASVQSQPYEEVLR